jgi:tetratricopeptide (TPR) repeat protein
MVYSTDDLIWIQEIEKSIEDALWTSVADEDYEKSLGEYDRAKVSLEAKQDISEDAERERKRVLSYCLMRINDALEYLERSEGSIKRAEESLRLAKESEDLVQTLRSKLALGVALVNLGKIPEAESHFTDIILQAQDETENKDVIQIYGWTLIVRVNILLGKSLYDQAKELANQALGVLSGITNYAGLRTTYSLLSRIYQNEGNIEKSEMFTQRSDEYANLAKEHRQ